MIIILLIIVVILQFWVIKKVLQYQKEMSKIETTYHSFTDWLLKKKK